MTTKKLIASSAVAALALPGAALADKGNHSHDGSHGKAKQAKQKKQKKGKSFTLKGISATNLTVTDGKLAGPLTLDPTSANRIARTFLQLSKTDLRGTKTVTLGTAADPVRITYVGLTAGTAPAATDTVKVIGRVKDNALDVRRIVVKREAASADSDKDSDSDKS